MIALLIAALIAVAIGVGVGVGVSHNKAQTNDTSAGTPTTTAISAAITAIATASPSPLKHGIMDDSAFAAVITSDGIRHVFFQDINGTIRQASRAVSSPTTPDIWGSPLDVQVASDARRNTPMAAIVRRYDTIDALGHDQVGLKSLTALKDSS